MFNKLKQFRDLRKKAKELQNQLATEKVTGSAKGGGVQVEMDGNQRVQQVVISLELVQAQNKAELEEGVKEAVNDALKALQRVMAKKLQEQGGLGALKDIL